MEANMFAEVKRINILSRSIEADMFAKVKRIDILFRSIEAHMFAKVKGSDIFSAVWISIFDKRLVSFIYSIL